MRAKLCLVESVRLDRAATVIGDAEIIQTELLRGFRHFFETVVTIAGAGVAMKCAAQIFLLDQLWDGMFLGGFKFTAIFPQLWRNEIEINRAI